MGFKIQSQLTKNVLSDITSAGADIESAVSLKHANTLDHTQGTDQGLDTGGANAVTAAQTKTGYEHSQIVIGNPHAIDITDLTSYAHNSLSNLNTGDYLHLTAVEYAILHPAVTVVGAPLTLSTQEITFNYDSNHFGLDTNNLQIKVDGIDATLIDWGTGANQVSASDIPIADGGGIITGTEVETALQENRTAIDLNTTHAADNSQATVII